MLIFGFIVQSDESRVCAFYFFKFDICYRYINKDQEKTQQNVKIAELFEKSVRVNRDNICKAVPGTERIKNGTNENNGYIF